MSRQQLERLAETIAERRRRHERSLHETRGYRNENGEWVGGLLSFVRYFWDVLEPATPFAEGWALEALCEHLEAITFGDITNFLGNVPPGFMKSLLTDVFFPAWEWGPMRLPHIRYIAFSYSASLTERDNEKFRDLILSSKYQAMYGNRFELRKIGSTKVTNNKHGFKLATSIGGVGTGERGDRIILDDPMNVKESESDVVRNETIRWFRESMSSRLNNMKTGAKIVIMQRVHEGDVSGVILEDELPYCHLSIPMEYEWAADDRGEPIATDIGWTDPRWEPNPEDCEGELAWPERFPSEIIPKMKKEVMEYGWAGQYQQRPAPRGGGIIKREYWQPWEPEDGKFPSFDYVVASLDTAFTENQENDPSAMTVWGVFEMGGYSRAMVITAWRKWLEFEGPKLEPDEQQRQRGESLMEMQERLRSKWGLVEWTYDTCKRWKVDRLLIEAKANGISAAQSLRKRYSRAPWTIQLMDPKGLDKVARTLAVQPAWSQEMIYIPYPLRTWGTMLVDEMAVFPKGRYRDLNDSATQAIKHLRDAGILIDDEEQRAAKVDAVRHTSRKIVNPYGV